MENNPCTPPFHPDAVFARINQRRRAIRRFDGRAIGDEVIRELVRQAQFAPSSGNTQPYRFLCARSVAAKALVASLCENQSAARTASALVIVTAGRSLGLRTLDAFARHLLTDVDRSEKSRRYHQNQVRTFRGFLRLGAWPLWSLLLAPLQLLRPATTLLPLGPTGIRHWTARSAIYAAQSFMLAASALGFDTCPMEGFNAGKLARALKLPRDVVIPLVIAIGHADHDARIEPRWRKSLDDALVLL